MPFQPGASGNPNGRPKGTGNRQQTFNAFVEAHREGLFNKALELALGGNEAMLRLFLERMLPAKPTHETIQIDLPVGNYNSTEILSNFGSEALRAVATGNMTSTEAAQVASLMNAHSKTYELVRLSDEIDALKEGR